MMSAFARVVPEEETSPLSGLGLLEDGESLIQSLESGSWVGVSLSGAGAACDAASLVLDPVQTLISWGVSWLLDHVYPLNEWLEELTGDAGEVRSYAQTWASIAQSLRTNANDLALIVRRDMGEMDGAAIRAYRAVQVDIAKHMEMAAGCAGAMSVALDFASTLVQFVHDMVRDAIGDVVGFVGENLLLLLGSVGLATPLVVKNVSAMVARWVGKLRTFIDDLLRSCKELIGLGKRLGALLERLKEAMGTIARGTARAVGGLRDGGSKMVDALSLLRDLRDRQSVEKPAPIHPSPSYDREKGGGDGSATRGQDCEDEWERRKGAQKFNETDITENNSGNNSANLPREEPEKFSGTNSKGSNHARANSLDDRSFVTPREQEVRPKVEEGNVPQKNIPQETPSKGAVSQENAFERGVFERESVLEGESALGGEEVLHDGDFEKAREEFNAAEDGAETALEKFKAAYGNEGDRGIKVGGVGGIHGNYLTLIKDEISESFTGNSSEKESVHEKCCQYDFVKIPDGYKVVVTTPSDSHFGEGGMKQVQVFSPEGMALTVMDMLKLGILE